jgi:hypothetical protein
MFKIQIKIKIRINNFETLGQKFEKLKFYDLEFVCI